MDINKQLIYYFYLDSYEIYEIYKIHLECILSYGDIFSKYIFILSVDDLDNYELIDFWKLVIQDYLKKNNIEFIIVKNNSTYREGLYWFEFIYKHLNDFDGLICWGHGKRDFQYYQRHIYEWVISSHYIMSKDIKEIERALVEDKYLFSGPYLSINNGNIRNCMYTGGFYWLYPKKIYNQYKEIIDTYILGNELYFDKIKNHLVEPNIITDYDEEIKYLVETNNLISPNIEYCHHYQNQYIKVYHYKTSDNRIYEINIMYYQVDFSNDLVNYYNQNIINREGFLKYYNKIMDNINKCQEKRKY